MRNQQKPETIVDYSTELKKRLAGILPPERIKEVVAETESHLEDRTDELVQSRRAAEARAVAEFVPPKKLAGGLIDAWSAIYLRHAGTRTFQYLSLTLSTVAAVGYLAVLLAFGGEVRISQPYSLFLAIAFFPFAVFLCAALACRFQPRRMAVLGLGTVLAYFLIGGWKFALIQPGQFVSRFTAAIFAQRSRTSLLANRELHATLIGGVRYLGNGLESDQKNLKVIARKYSETVRLQRVIRLSQTQLANAKKKNYPNLADSWQRQIKGLEDRLKENTLTKEEFELDAIERCRTDSNSKRSEAFLRNRWILPLSLRSGSKIFAPVFVDGRIAGTKSSGFLEGVNAWEKVSPSDLAEVSGRLALDRKRIQVSERLMASPRWRFDLAAAKGICTWGALYFGVLLLADTLGGLLGGFLLRSLRRRRPNGKEMAR